jgi:stage III sporulation protein AG
MNRKTEGVQRIWERYKWAVLVILAGVVALLWPSGGTKETSTAQSTAVAALGDPEALQEEMEEILSHISGVGEVRLLLTVETDGERQLAGNTETSYSGSASAPEDFSRSWEAVMAQDGGQTPVVTTTRYPTYRGALVVCQGGDQASVRLAVTEAVTALTGLPADRVSVAKWQ